MADSFGDRVAAAVRSTGPLCAGIDPSSALLRSWGLSDDAPGLRAFCAICVEAFAGTVAVVKPQVAFFERHGSAGMAELERLIADATAAGLLVIADAKRGDIDSTAEAYADAWLGDAEPTCGRRGDGAPVPRPGRAGAAGPPCGSQRSGRARRGTQLKPRRP